MDIEAEIIRYLRGQLDGAEVSATVPEPRPECLVTVERTGGAVGNQLDHPTLAVQSWAPTNLSASALSRRVDALMRQAPDLIAGVFGVEANTVQRWPDPEAGHPRYQGVYTLTTGI